jgi:hypothetical protein
MCTFGLPLLGWERGVFLQEHNVMTVRGVQICHDA